MLIIWDGQNNQFHIVRLMLMSILSFPQYTSALPFDLKSNYSVALEEKHLEAK